VDIKTRYTDTFLRAADKEPTEEEIKKYRSIWWWNLRQDQGGLRMTEHAMQFIEEHAKIKSYKIEFPKEFEFTPQVLLWLDKFIESPYYINKRHIIVLREKSAFELFLFSGDIRKLGHTKALAKRTNQELSSD
jgi:hypothetical protein